MRITSWCTVKYSPTWIRRSSITKCFFFHDHCFISQDLPTFRKDQDPASNPLRKQSAVCLT